MANDSDADGLVPVKADDDQLATYIAAQWQGKFAYLRSAWHVYESGYWQRQEESERRKAIREALVPVRELIGGIRQGRITALAAMLQDDCFIPDRKMNELERETARYINLINGLYDLERRQLEPHNPALYFTNQLSFAYDPAADCPNFKRFLKTSLAYPDGGTDHDMVALAQEGLAYSMTARTDKKASFWLVGQPDTGKSTLVGLIRELMGNLHATVDLNQLASNRFLLSGIVGKRVVTFTEADSNAFLPDALYKAMVGGQDEIWVDVKNKPGISFVPTAKFWWAMNSAPKVNDRSGATLNRLLPILFEHIIPPDQRNPNLPALLRQERPGIFNYLMIGWERLVNTGEFTRSDRSVAWREQYRFENDIEAIYSSERWDINPEFFIRGEDLYSNYRIWCESNGYKPKNAANAAKEWRRLGLTDVRSNGRTHWKGARLKPDSS